MKFFVFFFHGKLDEIKQKHRERKRTKKNSIKKLDLISIVSVFTAFLLSFIANEINGRM